MTREDHLKFCTVCQLKDFDARQGVICSLTGKQADFEGSCPTFKPTADADIHATPYDYPSTAINVENRMASTGKRFANHIVDTIVVYFLAFLSGFILAIGTELTTPGYIDSVDENDPGFTALSYFIGFLRLFRLLHFNGICFWRYRWEADYRNPSGRQAWPSSQNVNYHAPYLIEVCSLRGFFLFR